MSKYSFRHQLWIRHRNKKNLIRRTKRKNYRKRRLTQHHEYNREIKLANNYDCQKHSFSFVVPSIFSFVKNKVETTSFFENLIHFITDKRNFGKSLFIDISSIEALTTDALMYLLAIINNLNERFQSQYSISGNIPEIPSVRDTFLESGFLRYVQHRRSVSIEYKTDKVQIVTGDNSNTETAKQLSDFVCSKANVEKSASKFLYTMIIELMSNTHKHAYIDKSTFLPRWYCFAEYNGDVIEFTFLDTGLGVPSTVRKNFVEKLDFLKLKNDSSYVTSALNGEFRTETKHRHRGKGLPKIKEICTQGKIQNLRIISNKADVSVTKDSISESESDLSLRGTIYRWDINLRNLKGFIL